MRKTSVGLGKAAKSGAVIYVEAAIGRGGKVRRAVSARDKWRGINTLEKGAGEDRVKSLGAMSLAEAQEAQEVPMPVKGQLVDLISIRVGTGDANKGGWLAGISSNSAEQPIRRVVMLKPEQAADDVTPGNR